MTAGQWPARWRGDSPRDRDRRIARSYREALLLADPETCAELDATFESYGQMWMTPQPAVNPDAAITVEQAARLVGVTVFAVYKWISSGKLPRAPKEADGLTRVIVTHLIELDAQARRRRSGRVVD